MARKRKGKGQEEVPVQTEASPAVTGPRASAWLRDWWPLVVFIPLGLWLRLTLTLWSPIIFPDSMKYMSLAREMRAGVFFSRHYDLEGGFIGSRHLPPLYSLIIAPFVNTGLDLEHAAIVTSLLISMAGFIPFFIAGRTVFGKRAATLALALLAFNCFGSWYAYTILSEPVFTTLFITVICLSSLILVQPRRRWFILGGIAAALLYLSRDVGVTAAPIMAAAAVIKLRWVDRRPWRRIGAWTGALLAAFFLVSFPYLVHIRLHTGHWGLTAQMDNTSITRQIKAYGKDRYQRDMPGGETIKFLGGDGNHTVLSLVRVAPGIAAKTLRNLRLYGLELTDRAGSFALAFVLVGVAAIGRGFFRRRSLGESFAPAMVAGWLIQLWLVYAVVTPYMVDDRYMYPLSWPYLLLAGYGMNLAVEWLLALAGPREDGPRPGLAAPIATAALCLGLGFVTGLNLGGGAPLMIAAGLGLVCAAAGLTLQRLGRTRAAESGLVLVLPLGAMLWTLYAPDLIHPQTISFYMSIDPVHRQHPELILRYPSIGQIVLFALALAPAVRWGLGPMITDRESYPLRPFAIFAAAALLGGTGLYFIEAGGIVALPMFIALGAGLAGLVLTAAARGKRARIGLLPALSIIIFLAYFIVQIPDFMDLRSRVVSVTTKFSSGYKEIAADIKAKGLIPPGKVFCDRKPFLAYYLDGNWRLNKITGEAMPNHMSDLFLLMNSGQIDYLVADSFVLKNLRAELTPLAFVTEPLPGARVVYSRYIPDLSRLVTIFDVHAEEPPLPRATAAENLAQAQAFSREGDLVHALWHVDAAIGQDPNLDEALLLKMNLLHLYYRLAYRGEIPMLLYFPELLPTMVDTTEKYLRLNPNDPDARAAFQNIKLMYQRARQALAEYQEKTGAANVAP
jgi:hypothetical protein